MCTLYRVVQFPYLCIHIKSCYNFFYRFNQVTRAEAGQYICHADSEAGSTTAVATLIVQSVPSISISPSTDVQVVVGQRVKLECQAAGDPEPTVEWAKHRSGFAF
jgi:hypothetical protein